MAWFGCVKRLNCYDRGMSKTSKPNAAQLASPTYRLPALDNDFLLGRSMRGVRFLLEYSKADEVLHGTRVNSTIVVFGSARAQEDGAEHHARWYKQARAFARIASERGGALRPRDQGPLENVIATGGGPGVMEAANRGAHDVGAPSIGYNIRLPKEQEPNPYMTPELTFNFHYFAMRKMHFAMRANALVVFPGGFGTLDEMFEFLTLSQTGRVAPFPIVLFDERYWRSVINFDALIEYGTVAPDDLSLFRFAETADEIWTDLCAQGLPVAGQDEA